MGISLPEDNFMDITQTSRVLQLSDAHFNNSFGSRLLLVLNNQNLYVTGLDYESFLKG
jgi:hypothetical protein